MSGDRNPFQKQGATMPRLNVVEPDKAEGPVKELYNQVQAQYGKVFNIFQGMGNSAAALKAYLAASAALSEGELSPQDREVAYLTVSQRNDCHYCVSAHSKVAEGAGMSDDEITAVRKFEPQSDKHRALSQFVRRVMDTKGVVSDDDLAAVRDAGYTDGQIAEAVAYIGLSTYSNLFNHVHDTEVDFPPAKELA